VRIIPSAREHGISDEDMLHAVRVPLRVIDLDEETTLYIGAGLNGALLEVVVADLETEDPGSSTPWHCARSSTAICDPPSTTRLTQPR
jgi:hypothetical protein